MNPEDFDVELQRQIDDEPPWEVPPAAQVETGGLGLSGATASTVADRRGAHDLVALRARVEALATRARLAQTRVPRPAPQQVTDRAAAVQAREAAALAVETSSDTALER